MKETDRAWAAGFFDGEGHYRASLHRYPGPPLRSYMSLRARVSQKDPEVLLRFRDIMGVGKIYQQGNGLYYYQVTKRSEVQRVVNILWPYLGSVKRQQIIQAQEQYREFEKSRKEKIYK